VEKDVHALHLLLLLGLLVGLGLGALLADTDKAGLGASVAELAVGVLGGGVLGDLLLGDNSLVVDGESGVGEENVVAVADGLDLLGAGLALLGGLGVAREEDEALLVGLQALNVGLEGLLAEVLATGVDRDTDGARKLAGDVGLLQLGEGETTASTNATVVLDGGAADDRAELVDGLRSDTGGLLLARVATAGLLAGLELLCQDDAIYTLQAPQLSR
jgi:hypothetical protein